MRKLLTLLSTLVIVSALLVACAGEETETVVPGTDIATLTEEPLTDEPMTEVPATDEPTEEPTDTAEPTDDAGIPVTGAENPFLLSNQLDYDIWNGENDQIGEVENMVIDLSNSQVDYVYIETGGFLDIGDTESLVPWGALRLAINEDPDVLTADDNAFILEFDQALLDDAPDIDLDNDLPTVGEPAEDWDTDYNTYWDDAGVDMAGPMNGAAANELQGVILATDLLDASFGVDTNDDLVEDDVDFLDDLFVDNVIVDINTGQVLYVVLDAGFADGDRLMPVPLSQLGWDAESETFLVSADQETLEAAPYFVDGEYPNTMEEGWDSEYDTYWP